jgi:hypothetical protein
MSLCRGRHRLIDGRAQPARSGDSLRPVPNDWIQYGAAATNLACIRSRLA